MAWLTANKYLLIGALGLVILAYVIFSPITSFELLRWDDPLHVLDNPALYPPFSLAKLALIWRQPYFGMYIPVTYSSWALLKVFGKIPRDLHILNGIFHAANAMLVYMIARQLKWQHLAAWVAAALFLTHPLVVEPVAWISGFKDVSSTFWGLLACLIFIAGKRLLTNVAALLCFALAMLSKPSAIIFAPLAAILVFYCDFNLGKDRRSDLINKLRASPYSLMKMRSAQAALAAFAALPIVYLAMRLQPEIQIAERVAWAKRPLIALDTIAFYGQKMLLPWQLTPDYGRTPSFVLNSSWWPTVSLGTLILALSLYLFWRQKYLGYCLILSVTALLPNLGLLAFAFQDQSTVADRYAYPALLGFALAGASFATTRKGRIFIFSIIGVYSYLTVVQLPYWHNQKSLFTYMLKNNPNSSVAYDGLGSDAYLRGEWRAAEDHFRRALAINPQSARPWFNLGTILWLKGDKQEARAALEQSLKLAPDVPDTLNNLGLVYFVLGYLNEAESLLRRTLMINQFDVDARYNLSRVLSAKGQHSEANQLLNEVMNIQPSFLEKFIKNDKSSIPQNK